MRMWEVAKKAALSGALAAMGSPAMAVGSDVGIETGLYSLGQNLNAILGDAGGYVIIILSVILGAIALAITGRWAQIGTAIGVAVLLGYGVQALTTLGGVTASTDLLELLAIERSASSSSIQ